MMVHLTSPELFELIQRNRSLSNTIECMHRNDTLEQHLSFLNWDYFVTLDNTELLDLNRSMENVCLGSGLITRIGQWPRERLQT